MTIEEQLKWQSQDNSNLRESLQICKENRQNEYLINKSIKEEIKAQQQIISGLYLQIAELQDNKEDAKEPLVHNIAKSEVTSNYVKFERYQKVKANLDLFISKYNKEKERADKLEEQIKQTV